MGQGIEDGAAGGRGVVLVIVEALGPQEGDELALACVLAPVPRRPA